jgi:hypothetical protein
VPSPISSSCDCDSCTISFAICKQRCPCRQRVGRRRSRRRRSSRRTPRSPAQ